MIKSSLIRVITVLILSLGLVSACGGGDDTDPAEMEGPVLSGISVVDITGDSARVTWMTDQPASSQVQYGTGTGYGDGTVGDGALTVSQCIIPHSY